VYARRIDPVRARILNVPLPESGHRFGDILLHDGAPTGFRVDNDGSKVAVLNELERLTPSAFQTDVVFVSCVRRDDLQALLDLTAPGLAYAKDSTESVRYYCLRCSFGTPHRHDAPKAGDWQPDRNLGIAAQSRKSVEKLLKVGVAKGSKRSIDGIASRECKPPEREKLSGHSARATLKHSGPEKRSSRFRVFPAGSEAARHSPVHRLGQSSRRAFGLWLGRLWLGKALVLLWGLPNGIRRGVTR